MTSRHIPNTFPNLLTLPNPESNLKAALEDITTNSPPLSPYHRSHLEGLWSGPTGLSYLFLHVSARHPHLKISDHHALTWAKSYITPASRPSTLHLSYRGCGIGDEFLAFHAVSAAVTQDDSHIAAFLSAVAQIVRGDYPNELLYGRAGALYLLRLIRHWVPSAAERLAQPIAQVAAAILAAGPEWRWHGKRYLGAVHGDAGIVAQLVLARPELATEVRGVLEGLLRAQLADGNWPSSEGGGHGGLVQFCHGAPGVVHALLAVRGEFPGLEGRIDGAMERGRDVIWEKGLLRKEPSLCHGIFGNGLALALGEKREHFLAVATPEEMARLRQRDQTLFEPADYGKAYSLTTSYAPSGAWAWLVWREERPGVIGFNDV